MRLRGRGLDVDAVDGGVVGQVFGEEAVAAGNGGGFDDEGKRACSRAAFVGFFSADTPAARMAAVRGHEIEQLVGDLVARALAGQLFQILADQRIEARALFASDFASAAAGGVVDCPRVVALPDPAGLVQG